MGRTLEQSDRKRGTRTNKSIGPNGRIRAGVGSAKQVTKRQKRLDDERVATALAKAAKERERLDSLIARQQTEPALGATPGAIYAQEHAPLPEVEWPEVIEKPHRFEPWDGDPIDGYTIADARRMVRGGYAVPQVIRRTGVGYRWLDDIPVGDDGRVREAM